MHYSPLCDHIQTHLNRYRTAALSCLTEIAEMKCSSEAATFVQRIADGQKPPVCSQDDDEDSSNPRYKPSYTPEDGTNNRSSATINDPGVIFILSLFLALLEHMFHPAL